MSVRSLHTVALITAQNGEIISDELNKIVAVYQVKLCADGVYFLVVITSCQQLFQ